MLCGVRFWLRSATELPWRERVDRKPLHDNVLGAACSQGPALTTDETADSMHSVPIISRFYGILIQMYFDDHNPPHFHVVYDNFKAVIGINDLSILEGDLPPKAVGLVMEWARSHRKELLKDWELAKSKQPLLPIVPLE